MKKEEKDILATARKRFDIVCSANGEIEEEFKEDVKFIAGEQYTELEKKDRAGRPCLVINKVFAYANQVTNDIRQNEPSPKVRPSNSNNNGDAADVMDGLLRKIQADGDAEAAIDNGSEYAVYGGVGYWRIVTDYASDKNNDQNIYIKKIGDPLSVKFPFHLCKEADYSDVPYAFITSTISKDEYKDRFGDDPKDWDLVDANSQWVTDDAVVLCEYFSRSESMGKLYLIVDDTFTQEKPEDDSLIKSYRDVKVQKITWHLLSGGKVLDTKEFPGKYVPVIAVVGKELVVDGKPRFISLTRFARDPQKMYNYWRSMETETIAMAPKAPIVAAEGQLEGRTREWQNANRSNVSVLQYKPTTINGVLVPPPQRMAQVGVPAGFVNAANEATDDIKAVTGIHDASLGAEGNETSGKAIIARQREGDKSNFHFADNVARAVKHTYRLIINIVPMIFDTARQIRILGEDMKDKVVLINQEYIDEKGELKYYDLTSGDWDIYLDMGPSYATKRVEAAENMLQLMQAVPSIGQFGGDIVVRNMDFNQSEELSERLKKATAAQFPGIIEEEKQIGPDGQPIEQQQGESPEDMAAIMRDFANLQQENEQLKQQLGQIDVESMKLNQADTHKQMEIESQLVMAKMKAQTEIEKAKISRKNTDQDKGGSDDEK